MKPGDLTDQGAIMQDKNAKPERGIRIPADFTTRVLAKQATNVELFPIGGGNAPADALLIDEASMLDLQLFTAVLRSQASIRDVVDLGLLLQ